MLLKTKSHKHKFTLFNNNHMFKGILYIPQSKYISLRVTFYNHNKIQITVLKNNNNFCNVMINNNAFDLNDRNIYDLLLNNASLMIHYLNIKQDEADNILEAVLNEKNISTIRNMIILTCGA